MASHTCDKGTASRMCKGLYKKSAIREKQPRGNVGTRFHRRGPAWHMRTGEGWGTATGLVGPPDFYLRRRGHSSSSGHSFDGGIVFLPDAPHSHKRSFPARAETSPCRGDRRLIRTQPRRNVSGHVSVLQEPERGSRTPAPTASNGAEGPERARPANAGNTPLLGHRPTPERQRSFWTSSFFIPA